MHQISILLVMLLACLLPLDAQAATKAWLPPLQTVRALGNTVSKIPGLPRVAQQYSASKTAATLSSSAQQSEVARKCTSQLIALFSGAEMAASVDSSRSSDLLSCVRLLVPLRRRVMPEFVDEDGLDLPWTKLRDPVGIQYGTMRARQGSHRVLERLIRWPPRAVMDLARRVVQFGGDPSAFMTALSPEKLDIPDVEGSYANRCSPTKYDYSLRFYESELNAYMATLFQAINVLAPAAGFNVSLSRFDLFHGHVFLAFDTGRLGILFHAREYPAFDQKNFPYNLGYCQTGSTVAFDESMDLRNILWLAPYPGFSNATGSAQWLAPGALFILDANPAGVLFKELIPEYLDLVRTISEYDFGNVVADVNYFNLVDVLPERRIFIC